MICISQVGESGDFIVEIVYAIMWFPARLLKFKTFAQLFNLLISASGSSPIVEFILNRS